jgi:hypothetical protein
MLKKLTAKAPRSPRKAIFRDKKLGVLGVLAVQNHIHFVSETPSHG